MTLLQSFGSSMNVAVVGASGGIGRALVGLLAGDSRVSSIHALSRRKASPDVPRVTWTYLDLHDEASIKSAAETATQSDPLDLVIVSSGILWRGEQVLPEKAMREITSDNLHELFAVNTVGPTLVAKHFLPRLRKDRKTVFAALSARVGSIGDNRLGGWYAYRASKAALNMLLKTLSIEHARGCPESAVIGLHPGTVDTGLSEPYTSRTPRERLFEPEIAARHLLDVIAQVTPEDTGGFFAWDGKRIEY